MKVINVLILFFLLSAHSYAQVLKIGSKIDHAPEQNVQSLDSLICFINKNSSSDYEKAFGIYYWISHNIKYDYEKFKKGKPSYSKPQDVFRKRKAVCIGYATLYRYMCIEMKVNCQLIIGYSKGFGYKSG
jgi:transglutaminase/protease-like cytokinesis protein 3